ncbi:threonine ammonia-lyase, partial [Salmonella enterica subsp. enterica serovar Kentucky]
VRELVVEIFLFSEDEILNSIISLIQRIMFITVGAGALACAELLSGILDSHIQNRKTVSIICCGNIYLSRVSKITGLVVA